MIRTDFPQGWLYPMTIQPRIRGIKLDTWARSNRTTIDSWLLQYGALLFRGFDGNSMDAFESFVTVTGGQLLAYQERSSPRETVQRNIYTSTSHPSTQEIFLHNEQSYNLKFPHYIYFHCVEPAQSGGGTTISDTHSVYNTLPSDITHKFERLGYTYLRNFGSGLGLSWEAAYQTEKKSEVEQYCLDNKIKLEWLDQDRLRTRQVRECVARRPGSGEKVWFNHATFFNVTTLTAAVADKLCSRFADEELPNHTFYGDGAPIESEVLEVLRNAYMEGKTSIHWEKGDVLMLDNMRMAPWPRSIHRV